jgi:phospholipase/carboxylesterase
MPESLPAVEISTGPIPALAVIWLHGLGADGHDFEPIVPQLTLPFPVRYVFPHAPIRPVTINAGMRMRAWYDIVDLRPGVEDEHGVRESSVLLTALIDRELARGLASTQIVVAGFSQGGAIALHCGLRARGGLAGILALSTYLPLAEHLTQERSESNLGLPVFLAHGSADPVIPMALGLATRRQLEAAGYAVEWHSYAMGHAVCAPEIEDIRAWLAQRGRAAMGRA